MFIGRQYKRVSQQGDSDSDTTDNETAFFTSENGSRKWRMGTRLDNLNQDPELDLPYVHPTLPVEMKKNKLSGNYTRRQLISGTCLLIVILAMVAAFSATIILGQKFMSEAPPTTNNHNTPTGMPAPTPLVNFDPTEGNELSLNESHALVRQDPTQSTSTTGAMVTSSPTTKSISSVTSPPPPTISTIKTSMLRPTTSGVANERTNTAVPIASGETRLNPSPQIDAITTFKYRKENN